MQESEILQQILLALGSRSDLRIGRNNAGLFYPRAGARPVRCGIFPGAPDIIGLLRGGRFLGIEVKSATGRQRIEQVNCQRMIESLGGLYVLARSVDDAVKAVDFALGNS